MAVLLVYERFISVSTSVDWYLRFPKFPKKCLVSYPHSLEQLSADFSAICHAFRLCDRLKQGGPWDLCGIAAGCITPQGEIWRSKPSKYDKKQAYQAWLVGDSSEFESFSMQLSSLFDAQPWHGPQRCLGWSGLCGSFWGSERGSKMISATKLWWSIVKIC